MSSIDSGYNNRSVGNYFGFVSKPVSWFCDRLPSINSAARSCVAGGLVWGATHAVRNIHPQDPHSHDLEGGMAIALGSTMMISGVAAAIHYMRGNKRDSCKWLAGSVFAGALAMGASKVQPPQKNVIKLDDPLPKNEKQFEEMKVYVPKEFSYLQECNGEDANSYAFRVSCSKLQIGKGFIDHQELLEKEERARAGHTKTYILRDAGIVLKQDLWNRALRMQQALQLCKSNGFQHINIAQATVYKDFVVESLLPVGRSAVFIEKEQMGMYLNHLDAFSQAVREFTGLLCQSTHDDLNSHKASCFLRRFAEDHIPRFDNAFLYLENGVGKIAIPDLDSFEPGAPSKPKIEDVIRFFPHHYDQIIEEAKKHYPTLDGQDAQLLKVRDHALKYYDNIYVNHLNHLKSKNISLKQPAFVPRIDNQSIRHIQEDVLEKVYRLVQKDIWLEESIKAISRETSFSLGRRALVELQIVENLNGLIAAAIDKKVNDGSPPVTEAGLLMARSLYIDSEGRMKVLIKAMVNRLRELYPGFGGDLVSPASLFFKAIFEEFEERGIIASHRSDGSRYVIFV